MPGRPRAKPETRASCKERRRSQTSRPEQTKVAVIGGTGNLGFGLAVRLSKAYSVTIGSREESKASDAAAKATTLARVRVEGKTNYSAAEWCDVAILAVPELPPASFLNSLADALKEKLVISPIVPLALKDGVFVISLPGESAAERVAKALPGSRMASAFHTVPAPRLTQLNQDLAYDVLVAAQSREVYGEAAKLVSSVGKLRPLYAGPLTASRAVEAITAALLNAMRFNKLDSPSMRLV